MSHWIIKKETRKDEIQYTVNWSPWGSMDRWVINRIVPSEAGLFQLWVMEGRGMVLTATEATYYGGIRNSLREAIDEMAPAGRRLRGIIAGRPCWFRFSLSSSRETLKDLKAWYAGEHPLIDSEKREILIHEIDTMSKFPPPSPDIKDTIRKRMKDAEFGPQL